MSKTIIQNQTDHNKAADRSALSGDRIPEFTEPELQAMHRWCLKYRDLVRAGRTPTTEQDARFMAFHAICYAEGVSNG